MARKAALQSDVSATMGDQASEPAVAAEAQRISRDYDVLKKQYDKLLQDREELRLRGQVETERMRVSSSRWSIRRPRRAFLPRPTGRCCCSVCWCSGSRRVPARPSRMGQLKSTFATAGKLERAFDLPVLGTISRGADRGARGRCGSSS